MTVTADEVRAFRETHGVGPLEARRVARRDIDRRLKALRDSLYGRQWEGHPTCADLIKIIDLIQELP